MKELLLQLCAPAGVSGAEKPAAQEAAEALSAFAQVHTDASGNVIGEIAGHGPHILLDAHIDQVGMVVTGVDAEGFLRIDKCGGIDIRTLAAWCAARLRISPSRRISQLPISRKWRLISAFQRRRRGRKCIRATE